MLVAGTDIEVASFLLPMYPYRRIVADADIETEPLRDDTYKHEKAEFEEELARCSLAFEESPTIYT